MAGAADTTRRRRGWRARAARLVPYAFIAPNLLLFSVFVFAPVLFAAYMSLHEWTLVGEPEFIGAENFARLAGDRLFWRALANTALYSVATVPLSLALGLLLAIGLNRRMPLRTAMRSAYFLPVVVSSVVTAILFAWLFNDNYGVVNAALRANGLQPVPWLSSPSWALASLVTTTLWTRIGFCMVVYLAALQSIPVLYYEAARIDGASALQQFRAITWPLLGPATFLLLILNVIHSFQVFDLVYIMTNGGPGFSTTMLVQYIFQSAFANSEMGYASALGVVLLGILMAFTLVQWRVTRQAENVG